MCVIFALSSVSFLSTEYCLIVDLGECNKHKCWEIIFACYDPTFITPNYNRKQFYQHKPFYILHTGFSCAFHFPANIFSFTCRYYFSFKSSYVYFACEKIILIYESELYSSAQFLPFFTFKIRFEMQMRCWWLASYSYLISRSLLLHFLGVKITTQALKYSYCVKNLCLFWSLRVIILFLVIPH